MKFRAEGDFRAKVFGGSSIEDVKRTMNSGYIIDGVVTKYDKKDKSLSVNINKDIKGVIPFEEFEYRTQGGEPKEQAILSKVGRRVNFKIKSIDGDKVILSRKLAQEQCYNEYVSKLKNGDIVRVKVDAVENFGIFCDVGCGIVGLLPMSNFCIPRIRCAKDEPAFNECKYLYVAIKSIDKTTGRISLTRKELLRTWEEEASKLHSGDTVIGKVTYINDTGVFIKLGANLVGLAEPFDGVNEGDTVSVFVRSIIPKKMKVKLNIIHNNGKLDNSGYFNEYKITSGHISKWKYSPDDCEKVIETVFDEE